MIPKFLSQEQIEYIKQNYADTPNFELAKTLGVSRVSVLRAARHLGLTKSEEGMRIIYAYAARKGNVTKDCKGTHPPKGYINPKCKQHAFKKGGKPSDYMTPERFKQRAENRLKSWRETIEEERLRLALGEPQQTKLRLIRQSRGLVFRRSYLRKRGYYMNNYSCYAYWDENTNRSFRMEAECKTIRFAPLSELDESLRHTYRNRVIKCKKTTTPCQTESKQ